MEKLTVFFGTETGNCRDLAHKIQKAGPKREVAVEIVDLADCTAEVFSALDNPALVIISTWDDGAPPPDCVGFCESLEGSGDDLSGLSYAVLALGDEEYDEYCACGKQVDARLEALGGKRFFDRTDLGADFLVGFIGWSKRFWAAVESLRVA